MRILDRFSPVAIALLLTAAFLTMVSAVLLLSAVDEMRARMAMRRALRHYGACQTGAARDAAREAAAAKEGYRSPRMLLALLSAEQGAEGSPQAYQEAKDAYAKLDTSSARDRPAWVVADVVSGLLAAGEPDEKALRDARTRLEEAAQSDEKQLDAAVALAALDLRAGNGSGALRRCDAALSVAGGLLSRDGMYTAAYVRGAALERAGRLDEAMAAYGSAAWLEWEPGGTPPGGRDPPGTRHAVARAQWGRVGARRVAEAGAAESDTMRMDTARDAGDLLGNRQASAPAVAGGLYLALAMVEDGKIGPGFVEGPRGYYERALTHFREARVDSPVPAWLASRYHLRAADIANDPSRARPAAELMAQARALPGYAALTPVQQAAFRIDEARALAALGENAAAEEALREAGTLGFEGAALDYNLGVLAVRAGRFPEGLEAYRRAQAKGIDAGPAFAEHLQRLEARVAAGGGGP